MTNIEQDDFIDSEAVAEINVALNHSSQTHLAAKT